MIKSLKRIENLVDPKKIEVIFIGDLKSQYFENIKIRIRNLGNIMDENRLVQLYNAADVFLLPSRNENLPNMAIESIACGTPVVAYNIGGVNEIITHEHSGYLAKKLESSMVNFS